MTVRFSRFALLVVPLALLCAACSAVLAHSAAEPEQPLGDPLKSQRGDGANVSGVSVDHSATSSSSFSKMFGDLARQSDAPAETPASTDNPTEAADTTTEPPTNKENANQSPIDSHQLGCSSA